MLKSIKILATLQVSILFFASISAAQARPSTQSKPSNTNQIFSGSGDSVITVAPVGKPVLISLTHEGASNFLVFGDIANHDDVNVLAHTVGVYSGTCLLPLTKKKKLSSFRVFADGNWTITIKPLSEVTVWGGKSITGTGDAVVKIPKSTKARNKLVMQHVGNSYFTIFSYSKTGSWLGYKAQEHGNYIGTSKFGKGTMYLEIKAEGNWTLTKSK